jgi:putative molybdopterin biosynthesis protein
MQQRELAERVGVSRQTLGSLESGETVPATSIALELARVLGCRVEEIFWLSDEDTPFEALMGSGDGHEEGPRRVAVAAIGDRWVAHPVYDDGTMVPADAVVVKGRRQRDASVRLRPLRDHELLRQNLLVAGCDPALSLLGGHLAERSPGRLHWVETGSRAALEMLAGGKVNLAGLHLFDEEQGEYNVPAVRRRLPDRAVVLVNLAVWELGLVVAPGNPGRIVKVADLGRKGVRLVAREDGTGAQELLYRLTSKDGVPRRSLVPTVMARGHAGVALAVASGTADAGIATRAAAVRYGLPFAPLAEERFDLAMPALDPRVERLQEILATPRFRRELGSLPGYGTARTGRVVAELAP